MKIRLNDKIRPKFKKLMRKCYIFDILKAI